MTDSTKQQIYDLGLLSFQTKKDAVSPKIQWSAPIYSDLSTACLPCGHKKEIELTCLQRVKKRNGTSSFEVVSGDKSFSKNPMTQSSLRELAACAGENFKQLALFSSEGDIVFILSLGWNSGASGVVERVCSNIAKNLCGRMSKGTVVENCTFRIDGDPVSTDWIDRTSQPQDDKEPLRLLRTTRRLCQRIS